MLRGMNEVVEFVEDLIKWKRLLGLLEAEGRLDLELNFEDQPRAAQAAERRHEQLGLLLARTVDARTVR